jgi:hypothetical protein
MADNPQNTGLPAPTSPPSNPVPTPQQQVPQQPKPAIRRVMLNPNGWIPKAGDLFVCRYTFWKHDPSPLVLVSSRYKDGRVAGVNLHNLTLNDMKNLIAQYCNKSFNYQTNIKGRKEIIKGFRTYRPDGLKKVRMIDCQYFLSTLGVVQHSRMMSPGEVEKIRQQIQQQLRQKVTPTAQDLTKNSQQQQQTWSLPGKPASVPGIANGGQQQQPDSGGI